MHNLSYSNSSFHKKKYGAPPPPPPRCFYCNFGANNSTKFDQKESAIATYGEQNNLPSRVSPILSLLHNYEEIQNINTKGLNGKGEDKESNTI